MTHSDDKTSDKPAILVLEDGTCFEGSAAGWTGNTVGEVVFNTSMAGYQEILTDPSYAGQLVTLTMPHIGNYGVNPADMESERIQARGLIVRSISEEASNYRSESSLPDWLNDNQIVAIDQVDTRALTRHIRDKGVMMGVIAHGATEDEKDEWLAYLEDQPDYESEDFVGDVVHREAVSVRLVASESQQSDAVDEREIRLVPFEADEQDDSPHVVVVDYGVKFSILRNLIERGLRVTLVPGDTDIEQLRSLDPDGVLLSNGPGDPGRLDSYLSLIEGTIESYPTFGICLGHQLLARALGAETFKLPFGHRGPNQPVKDKATGKIAMTSQNHGYAVKSETLPETLEVTHINLNDDTVEGVRHRDLPVFSVQYHPEAGPGPHDAADFFDDFERMVRESR
ncbi:MAG: glutamine-hydrolyzing carbamoyl-phosphate synthase small subunit [Myxococcota bacterium]